jgi:histidine triad (HIT) family protein
MDCVFCRIVSGEIPCMKVYEDAHTLVFMDIANDVDGHLVAIPKKHVKSLLDCDRDTLHRLMDAVQAVSEHLTGHCGYEGVNLLNASEEAAEQSVPHFHVHIIPRKAGDGVEAWPAFTGAKEDVQQVWQRLRME